MNVEGNDCVYIKRVYNEQSNWSDYESNTSNKYDIISNHVCSEVTDLIIKMYVSCHSLILGTLPYF